MLGLGMGSRRPAPAAFIRLGRPLQWTKNLVAFAALVFSGRVLVPGSAPPVVLTFIAFCLLSSAVYAVNDLFDAEEDRRHPVKKARPVASGDVTPAAAAAFAVVLGAVSLALAYSVSPSVGAVCTGYGAMNLAYARWLKHMVILDVMAVSSGFVLRAVAGAEAALVVVSPWLLVCTVLLSLFIAMCKRRSELASLSTDAAAVRKVLGLYSLPFLDQMIATTSAATIMAYCMYGFSSPTARDAPYLMLTVPFVVYGIFRYLYLVYHRGAGGEPERVLISDGPLLVDIALWCVSAGVIMYLS